MWGCHFRLSNFRRCGDSQAAEEAHVDSFATKIPLPWSLSGMILALNNRTARAGTESGARGGAPEKPGPKPGQRPGFSHAARPLAGAEVLVAAGGHYPGEVGEEKNNWK